MLQNLEERDNPEYLGRYGAENNIKIHARFREIVCRGVNLAITGLPPSVITSPFVAPSFS
jgi:hypothetical protein